MDTAAWFSAFASYHHNGSDIIQDLFHGEFDDRFQYDKDDECELDAFYDGIFNFEHGATIPMQSRRPTSGLAASRAVVIVIETTQRLVEARKVITVSAMRVNVYVSPVTITYIDDITNFVSVTYLKMNMSEGSKINEVARDFIPGRLMLLLRLGRFGYDGRTDQRRWTISTAYCYCKMASYEKYVLSAPSCADRFFPIITLHTALKHKPYVHTCPSSLLPCLSPPEVPVGRRNCSDRRVVGASHFAHLLLL